MQDSAELLTIKEVAYRIGVSTRTLRRWVRLGAIQPAVLVRDGGIRCIRFSQADIDTAAANAKAQAKKPGRPISLRKIADRIALPVAIRFI